VAGTPMLSVSDRRDGAPAARAAPAEGAAS
jgi:hypothetical protein